MPNALALPQRLITRHLHDLEGRNPHTIRARAATLEAVAGFAIVLDSNCLKRFDIELARAGYSGRTRALHLSHFRQFIVWMDAHDVMPDSLNRSKAEARLRDHLGRKKNEFRYHPRKADMRTGAIRWHYDSIALPCTPLSKRLELLRNRAIMHVLFDTAARRAEVASLTREMVQHGHAYEIYVVGKGNVGRVAFLTPPTRHAIQAYLCERTDPNPALFVSYRADAHNPPACDGDTIYRVVKLASAKAGLPHIGPHMIRHFVATDMLNRGVPLETVQDYLAHASPETTRTVYAHTLIETMRRHIHDYHAQATQMQQPPLFGMQR